MYAVGSRCCWMATSFGRVWRFGQWFLARSLLVCCLFAAWQRVIETKPTMIIIIVVKLIIINLIQSLLLLLLLSSAELDPLIDSPSARSTLRLTHIKLRMCPRLGTWRSWGTTVLYAQARSGSKRRLEPDTEPGHYAWHPYSLWTCTQGIHNYAAKKWNSIEPSLLIWPDRTHKNIYTVYTYTLSMHIQCLYIVVSLFWDEHNSLYSLFELRDRSIVAIAISAPRFPICRWFTKTIDAIASYSNFIIIAQQWFQLLR